MRMHMHTRMHMHSIAWACVGSTHASMRTSGYTYYGHTYQGYTYYGYT